MRSAGALLALAQGACVHLSHDGRFCCPSWCDGPCGGPEGLCSQTALEEVGTKECGKFAPPCLMANAGPPMASAPSAPEPDTPSEPAEQVRFLAPQPPMPSPESVAAVEQPLDQDLEAVPIEDHVDVGVESAARTHMISTVEDQVAQLDRQVEAASVELEQQTQQVAALERVTAPPAGSPRQAPAGRLLAAGALPDVKLPELARVEALSQDMQLVERSWEASNTSAVETEEKQNFRGAAQAVKRAAKDRALLDLSLADLKKELGRVQGLGKKLRGDAHLEDISPALLRDLHNLRKGAFMQTGDETGAWSTEAEVLERQARAKLIELEVKVRQTARRRAGYVLERAAWAATLDRLRAASEQAEVTEQARAAAQASADAEREKQDVALELAAAQRSAEAAQAGVQAAGEAESLSSLDSKADRAVEILSRANRTVSSELDTAGGAVRSGVRRLTQGARELQDVQDAGTLSLDDKEKASFAQSLRQLDRTVSTARTRSLALRADEQALLGRSAGMREAEPRVARAVQTAHDAVGVLGEAALALGKSAKLLQRQAADALADEQAMKRIADG